MDPSNQNSKFGGGLEPSDGPGESFPHPLPGGGTPGPVSPPSQDNTTGSDNSNSGYSREGGGGAPASLGNAYSPTAKPPGSSPLPNSDPSQWYVGPQHRGPSPPLRSDMPGMPNLPSIGGAAGNSSGFVAGPNAGGGNGGGSNQAGVTLGPSGSGKVFSTDNQTQAGDSSPLSPPLHTMPPSRMPPGSGPPTAIGGNGGLLNPIDPIDMHHPPSPSPTATGGERTALASFQDANGNSLLPKMDPIDTRQPSGQPTAMGGGNNNGLLNPIDPIDMHHPPSPSPTATGGSQFDGGVTTPEAPGASQGFDNGFPGGQIASADTDMFGQHHTA